LSLTLRRLILGVGVALAAQAPPLARSDAANDPATPQLIFKDLFAAVQEERLFADGKSFVDAVPRMPPEVILREFHRQRPDRGSLRTFVEERFELPQAVDASSPTVGAPIGEHIDQLWDTLTRSSHNPPAFGSLLSLPKPYVVPGGRFREMYYWDSYFTMLGLLQSGRRDLLGGMVEDFAFYIDTYGHIPNGARSYYLSRSQPPFFFAMVALTAADDPASAYEKYLPQLKREHAFWMSGEKGLRAGQSRRRVVALSDGSVLNRYWDDSDLPRDESFAEDRALAQKSQRPAAALYRDIRAAAESGWDFGSRWFADGRTRDTIDTTHIVPIDLNSLMYGLEQAIAQGCARSGDQICGAQFERRAARRKAACDRYLFSRGRYLDYSVRESRTLNKLSAATLYPLFTGMASRAQATQVAAIAQRELLKAGGVVTTLTNTGQQWDAPNGWAPLQWIAISGLRSYDETNLADTIACRFMAVVNDVYHQTGKLVEKYDVVNIGQRGGGGEYPTQDGFGWTNGVMRKLMAMYPAYADRADARACPTSTKSP
jgi:alpha,alpha-trehalase